MKKNSYLVTFNKVATGMTEEKTNYPLNVFEPVMREIRVAEEIRKVEYWAFKRLKEMKGMIASFSVEYVKRDGFCGRFETMVRNETIHAVNSPSEIKIPRDRKGQLVDMFMDIVRYKKISTITEEYHARKYSFEDAIKQVIELQKQAWYENLCSYFTLTSTIAFLTKHANLEMAIDSMIQPCFDELALNEILSWVFEEMNEVYDEVRDCNFLGFLEEAGDLIGTILLLYLSGNIIKLIPILKTRLRTCIEGILPHMNLIYHHIHRRATSRRKVFELIKEDIDVTDIERVLHIVLLMITDNRPEIDTAAHATEYADFTSFIRRKATQDNILFYFI